MASVAIRDVRKSFGPTPVIHGVDVSIQDGEFVVLVGPSGCGKSTLLRMIAGLENITRRRDQHRRTGGQQPAAERARRRHGVPELRALSAHDGGRQHGVLAEAARRAGKAEIDTARQTRRRNPRPRAAISNAIRASFPAASASASPWAAPSCAIRRCFCSTSRSPTSTPSCASHMRTEIKELHQRLKTTTVYVTHDQIEAMTMADKIVVMHDGIVEQIGTPLDLYDKPANQFVAGFIGSPAMNFLKGKVEGQRQRRLRRPERRQAAARDRARRIPTAGPRSTASGPSISPSPTTAPKPKSWWSSRPARRRRCSPSSAARKSSRCSANVTNSSRAKRSGSNQIRRWFICSTRRPGKRLNCLNENQRRNDNGRILPAAPWSRAARRSARPAR